MSSFKGTTIVAVRKDGHVAIAGDGQVTAGDTILKSNAHKVRTLYDGKVITGFAGTTADAFTLFELFEAKLKQFNGDLTRSAVELAKQWRVDKQLRQLEAMMLVSDGKRIFLINGAGMWSIPSAMRSASAAEEITPSVRPWPIWKQARRSLPAR